MPSIWLGSDKFQFHKSLVWFDHEFELMIPRTRVPCSIDSATAPCHSLTTLHRYKAWSYIRACAQLDPMYCGHSHCVLCIKFWSHLTEKEKKRKKKVFTLICPTYGRCVCHVLAAEPGVFVKHVTLKWRMRIVRYMRSAEVGSAWFLWLLSAFHWSELRACMHGAVLFKFLLLF